MAKKGSGLTAGEAREWRSVRAKGKRHSIAVRRIGPSSVIFGDGTVTILGVGRATELMDARIALRKKRKKSR